MKDDAELAALVSVLSRPPLLTGIIHDYRPPKKQGKMIWMNFKGV